MDEIGTRVVELIAETGKLDRADVKPESSIDAIESVRQLVKEKAQANPNDVAGSG